MQETWGCMEELVDEGLAKNIGISNFQGSLICDIMRYARIEPQVLQVEIHPYLTQEPLLKFCKTLGMAVTAYSSLGPQSYVELGMDKGAVNLLKHDLIESIAQARGKCECSNLDYDLMLTCSAAPAQVLLRWATQQGLAVIPKSNYQEYLLENLESVSFDLSEEEMKKISGLNVGLKVCSRSVLFLPSLIESWTS
jgi:D-xylose reductase